MAIKDVEGAIEQVIEWIHGGNYWHLLDDNETSVRYALIDPVLRSLGWDTGNLDDCVTEYRPDNKRGRADYVLFGEHAKVCVIVEAKATKGKIDRELMADPRKLEAQLYRYYTNSPTAQLGVITNGLMWRLYDFRNPGQVSQKRIEKPIDLYTSDTERLEPSKVKLAARVLHEWLDVGNWWEHRRCKRCNYHRRYFPDRSRARFC